MKVKRSITLILVLFILFMGLATSINAASTISMSRVTISSIANQRYTGSYLTPNVVVRYNGKLLTKGRDYTVTYSNNRNVGTATARITGKGSYSGTRTVNFKIVSTGNNYYDDNNHYYQTISMSRVTINSISNQTYTGNYIKPKVTVKYNGITLREGTDYTLTYSNNRNVGTATVKITGKGNYTGSRTITFRIVSNYTANKISISRTTVSNILNQTYTGRYIEPTVTVRYNGTTLRKGTDYTLTYSNNRNVGTATVKITGKGNYTGTRTVNFKIVNSTSTKVISMNRVKVQKIEDQYYTGYYIEPNVVLTFEGYTLREGRDYTISYNNNKNVGYGSIYIKGIGNYSGTKTISFRIRGNSLPISQATVSNILNQTYTGNYIKPSVTVKYNGYRLEEGIDYTLSYSNNRNEGRATIQIVGKGNYTGTKTVTFLIVRRTVLISNATVSTISTQTYTGRAIQPTITVKYNGKTLRRGTDYTVTYSNNINIGTATVRITGRGDYTGTKTVTFRIVRNGSNQYPSNNGRISMSNVSVSNILNQLYTGYSIRPSVVVRYNGKKLVQGTDYTLTYSNNRSVGTATVKITGRGNYTGTKTVTFRIVKR